MRLIVFLFILSTSSNSFSIEQHQLISVNDLDYLFKNNVKKWNETVVFLDKKISMSKVSNNDEIYFLKSSFKNGAIIIKPYFKKNVVSKINLEYELNNFDKKLNNKILKHYAKLEDNYCTKLINKKSKIIIEIFKCD